MILLYEILLLGGLFIFGLYSAAHERVWGAIFTMVGIGAVAYYYGYLPDSSNWPMYVASFFGYFLLGGIYAMFISWPRYIKRHKQEIINISDKFNRSVAKDETYHLGRDNFMDTTEYRSRFTAASQKDRIVSYICLWLWDMIWVVIKNPVVWAYNTVYDMFGRGYERVARNTTAKIIVEHERKKDA